MTNMESIENDLQKNGIQIKHHRVCDLDGYYREYSDGSVYLAVAPDMTHDKQFCVAAHEMGHYIRGLSGNTGKDEQEAARWATFRIASPARIIDALESGRSSVADIADFLNLTPQFLIEALEIYRKVYGEYHIFGAWILAFYPRIMAYNYQEKRALPEES